MPQSSEQERVDDPAMFKSLDSHAQDRLSQDKKSEVIESIPSIYMRGAIYLFIGVIICLLIGAYFGKAHIIIPVQGRVVPEGENLTIEAQSKGIITKIFVSKGDRVEAGTPIIELAQVSMGADLTALQNKLRLEKEKLESLKTAIAVVEDVYTNHEKIASMPMNSFIDAGPALGFINQLRTAAQDVAKANKDLESDMLRSQRNTRNQIAVVEETLRQERSSLQVARRGLGAQQEMLEIKKEELEQLKTLEEQRIVPRSQVVQARNSLISSESQLNSANKTIGDSRVRISELQARVVNLRSQLERTESELKSAFEKALAQYEQAHATLGGSLTTMREGAATLESSIVDLENNLTIKEGEADRLIVRAPRAGELTDLAFNTPGQAVGQGTAVATVVPDDVRLIMVATLPNKDIGRVTEGVAARIKVDAYPFRQYGTVPARVDRVFPKPDKPEFVVHLSLDRNTIRVDGKDRSLEPGLTATADILTKKQRILTMLLKKSN